MMSIFRRYMVRIEEEFDKYVEDTTETYLDEKMIVTLIASENNIKVSTKRYYIPRRKSCSILSIRRFQCIN